MRRFAEDTSVSVGRSRGEIDDLLRNWGCLGIQWTDEYDKDRMTLQFSWPHDGLVYMARFSVSLPSRKDLEKHAVDNRSGQTSQIKLDKLLNARGRQEMRVLLLWLKAALNAVEVGIVSADEVFLPFLVGADGRTVAEVAIPRMKDLLIGDATRLLPSGQSSKSSSGKK